MNPIKRNTLEKQQTIVLEIQKWAGSSPCPFFRVYFFA